MASLEPSLTARQVAQLAERLVVLRSRAKLTQRQLEEASGVSVGLIASIERRRYPDAPPGKRQPNPSLGTLMALLRAFDLSSVEELLGPLPTSTFRDDVRREPD